MDIRKLMIIQRLTPPTCFVYALLTVWNIQQRYNIHSFSLKDRKFNNRIPCFDVNVPLQAPFTPCPRARVTTVSAVSANREEPHHNTQDDDEVLLDGYERFIRRIQQQQQQQQQQQVRTKHRADPFTETYSKQQLPSASSSSYSSSHVPWDTNLIKDRTIHSKSKRYNNSHRKDRRRHHPPYYKRDPYDDRSIVVNETKIHHLISQRSQAQKRGDYSSADRIRDELNDIHGVYVWDTDSLWSTSPIAPSRRRRAAADDDHNTQGGGQENIPHDFGIKGHDYKQVGDLLYNNHTTTTTKTLSISEINSLLAKRLAYKLLKQFHRADEVKRYLLNHGVYIHDGLRLWRADGKSFDEDDLLLLDNEHHRRLVPSTRPFTLSMYSQPFHTTKQQQDSIPRIQSLIQARSEARARKDYTNADEIRTQLWNVYQVAVDDKTRTWSVGGNFGPQGTFRWTDQGPVSIHSTTTATVATKKKKIVLHDTSSTPTPIIMDTVTKTKPMYTISLYSFVLENPMDNQEVWNLVHDRLEAQRVHDLHVAEFIEKHLLEKYNVIINDSLQQYSVGGIFDDC